MTYGEADTLYGDLARVGFIGGINMSMRRTKGPLTARVDHDDREFVIAVTPTHTREKQDLARIIDRHGCEYVCNDNGTYTLTAIS